VKIIRSLKTVAIIIIILFMESWNQDRSVGIATSCGLNDRGIGVRFSEGGREFSLLHSDRLWDAPGLEYNLYWGLLPWGNTAGE
jgi:hypothetical protein